MVDFVGGTGVDVWLGTEQADTAAGNGGDDILTGNGGNDILSGGEGADRLDGGNGDDFLFSQDRDPGAVTHYSYRGVSTDFGTEADILTGGSGDDFIVAGYGDTVDGGAQGSYGNRLYVTFRAATSGVTADFRLLQAPGGSVTIGGGVITNIQTIGYLEGSNFDDVLVPIDTYYATGANVFGLGGNDHIIGSYYSGWNASSLNGDDGDDLIDASISQYGPALYGGAGNDTLITNPNGTSVAYGGDGDDIIHANGRVEGGAGSDTIYIVRSSNPGTVNGGAGNDTVYVDAYGSGTIFGNDGDDILVGDTGCDILTGGAGNDMIMAGDQSVAAYHFYNPYRGDVAGYSGNASDYLVTRDAGTGVVTVVDQRSGSPDGTDTLTNVEFLKFANGVYSVAVAIAGHATGIVNFTGTANADTYYGSEDANTATGLGNDDIFYGGGGNDVMHGNAGADYLDGGTGDDTLGSNDPFGPASVPTLDRGSERDTLLGGAGNDTLSVGYGDMVDGGADYDIVRISFRGSSAGVTVDFNQATLTVGGGTIANVEAFVWVEGSDFADDMILQDNVSNAVAYGMDGDDRIIAGSHTNFLDGGSGNDFVDGRNSRAYSVSGGAGNDTLYGSSGGANSVDGGDGDDIIYAIFSVEGGAGNDTIFLTASHSNAVINGGAGNDIIHAAPDGRGIMSGGDGDDSFVGKEAWDTFTGGAGNDSIDGGGQSIAIPLYYATYIGDIAIYSSMVADYLVTQDSVTGVVTIVDRRNGSPDGTDTLINVETFKFANAAYSLTSLLSGYATGVQSFVGTANADVYHGSEDSNSAVGNDGDDSFYGHGGIDILQGNGGSDWLDGGWGNDLLFSGTQTGGYNAPYYGNPWTAPTLDTGTEVDTLIGGDGEDKLFAGYGDHIDGGAGHDSLLISFRGAGSGVTVDFRQSSYTVGGGIITGVESVEWAEGSNFDDDMTMPDTSSSHPVFGLGGNDRLIGGQYTSYIDGGEGNDLIDARASYSLQSAIGGAGDDMIYTISNASASGGDGNDLISGSGVIDGGAGDDRIYIQQDAYSAQVRGGTGDDLIVASSQGSASVFGDDGNDTLTGGIGNDILDGGAGNDIISGGGGLNTLRGGIGNDRFEVGTTDSGTIVEGGADIDTLVVSGAVTLGSMSSGIDIVELNAATLTLTRSQFETALAANTQLAGSGSIVVTMASGATVNGAGFTVAAGASLTLTVDGSAQNDVITGVNGIANTLNGAGGSDVLRGGTVGDILRGDSGDDLLDGGAGIDTMDGGTGDDIILLDNDGDIAIGGDGIDTVRFAAAVTHTAAADVERFENTGAGDVFAFLNALANSYVGGTGIDLVYGGDGGDTLGGAVGNDGLFGQGGDDILSGGDGFDKLDGGAGNDVVNGGADSDAVRGGDGDDVLDGGADGDAMNGGAGFDIITGGGGRDKFRFGDGDSGNTLATADRITDLDQALGERVSLTAMDAIVGGADDAFTFIGTAAFGNIAGELRYELIDGNTYVMGDTDGDGASDFMIRLDGALVLTGADFFL